MSERRIRLLYTRSIKVDEEHLAYNLFILQTSRLRNRIVMIVCSWVPYILGFTVILSITVKNTTGVHNTS